MKEKGMWNDVIVVTASDFARTLTDNGLGTDHGWGGVGLVLGGDVKGGQILGEYPSDISEGSSLRDRRAMIPTTSYESVWNAIAQWMGVEDEARLLARGRLGNGRIDRRLFG